MTDVNGTTTSGNGAEIADTVRASARDEPVAVTVVRAVSAATGRSHAELPPLAGVVDPDALNALFGPTRPTTDHDLTGSLSFRYGGCHVRVYDDGHVLVDVEGD